MTTLLPTPVLASVRSVKKAAAVLIVCILLDRIYPGRANADFEIADILEQDQRTVLKQLRSMSAAGLVLEQRPGWYVLTPDGRNTLFDRNLHDPRQTSYLSIEEPKVTDARTQNVLMIDDDIKSINDNDSSPSIKERTNCAQILEATSILFGSAVSLKGVTGSDPEVALAWISKAWNDRKSLRNPCGLIYKRLKDGEEPPASWMSDPCYGLPEEFLRAVGRWNGQAVEVVDEESPAVVLTDDWRACCLQMPDLPRGFAFHTREASEWDGDVLRVTLTGSKSADDFNRVAGPVASRTLSEIVGRVVTVEFVCEAVA